MAVAAPLIGAAAAGGFAAATGTTIFGLSVASSAFLIAGSNLALGFLTSALAPKPPSTDLGSTFAASASERTQTLRSATAPRRRIYGELITGGILTFYEETQSRKYHHLIFTICDGEIDGFGTVFVNDEPVNPDDIDASGNVIAGTYKGLIRFKFYTGAADQVADPDLLAEIDYLDENFRGAGVAYVIARVEWSRSKMPNGLPGMRFTVRGQKIEDPRSGVTAWTDDAALVWRDFVADDFLGLAVHGASLADINATDLLAAANLCDEIVETSAIDVTAEAVDPLGDTISITDDRSPLFTGDRVTVSSTGAIPAGLSGAIDYYVIVRAQSRRDSGSPVKLQLAASLADARNHNAVDITGSGSGKITITKTGEPRYTASGLIQADSAPGQVLDQILTAMLGMSVFSGGTWSLLPAAWRAPDPELKFDENDLRGPLTVQTRASRRDRYNAVKGIYASAINDGEASEYPVVTSSSAQAADGGFRIYDSFDQPFTARPSQAQRLAGVRLKRFRQEGVFSGEFSLKAYNLRAGSVMTLSNKRRNWVDKTFEVLDWSLKPIETDGQTALVVAMTLRETASSAYDWDASIEETNVLPSFRSGQRSSFDLVAPGLPSIDESLYSTRSASGLKVKAIVSVDPVEDAFVDGYRYEYRESGASDWILAQTAEATAIEILDLAPGFFDFRVATVNDLGARSDWSEVLGVEILGLADIPADPTGLTISAIGGLAVLRYDQSPDLDVREGGLAIWRHVPSGSAVSWAASTSIGDPTPGGQTLAVMPLKPGSYLMKFEDSSGNRSDQPAIVETKQATVLDFTATNTITESTSFPGTKTNCTVSGGELALSSDQLFDDIADLDAVTDLDFSGGVALSGLYEFSAGFDFGSVVGVRLTAIVVASIQDIFDLVDSRVGSIDDWESFDGDASAPADAVVWVRSTDDDPAGSPTWSDWQRLDSAEFTARAFDPVLRLSTSDPSYTIKISTLTVQADRLS